MSRPARHIVVFCGSDTPPSTAETVEAMTAAHPDWAILIVQVISPSRRFRPYLKAKLRRIAREPVSYPLELLYQCGAQLRPRRRRYIGGNVRAKPLGDLGLPNVTYRTVSSLHDESTLSLVREFQPWLGIALGSPLLPPALFEIPAEGTINVHRSLLPDYRGMPPGFWELYDGSEITGVTVHQVTAELDAGDILGQVNVPIAPYVTPNGVGPVLDEAAIPLLLSVLDRLDAGECQAEPQGPTRTPMRSNPPFLTLHGLRRRLKRRRQRAAAPGFRLRRTVKAIGQAGFVYLWVPLRNFARARAGRARVTVLLYHRVNDEFLDNVTVGVEQFAGQLRLLKQRYDVLDLPEFLAARGQPRRRPAVVITFDDGYRDNHLAARLLRREGLPATFFVSTSIVGSGRPFPHDLRKLGRPVPALSWEQAREMADWGFHIGAHTATHANVSTLSLDEAKAEIRTAMKELTHQLGRRGAERWFAYPHGKRSDITAAVRDALGELGVTCCLSAYGGVNPVDYDPLDIRRQGVNWRVNSLGLRAIVEDWQTW